MLNRFGFITEMIAKSELEDPQGVKDLNVCFGISTSSYAHHISSFMLPNINLFKPRFQLMRSENGIENVFLSDDEIKCTLLVYSEGISKMLSA